VIDLVLRALQLLLIGRNLSSATACASSSLKAGEGGLLFVLQLIDDLYPFMQQGQFFIRCAVILQLFQPKLDALQAVFRLVIFLEPEDLLMTYSRAKSDCAQISVSISSVS
jgi:hypothetical protein